MPPFGHAGTTPPVTGASSWPGGEFARQLALILAGVAASSLTRPRRILHPHAWQVDAPLAAPGSHRVLLDNDRVRVLEVVIEPGAREPGHTHQAPSVMIAGELARIRYHQGGELRFESQARPGSPPGMRVRWMEPEGPHSVENIGQRRYHAICIEPGQITALHYAPAHAPPACRAHAACAGWRGRGRTETTPVVAPPSTNHILDLGADREHPSIPFEGCPRRRTARRRTGSPAPGGAAGRACAPPRTRHAAPVRRLARLLFRRATA